MTVDFSALGGGNTNANIHSNNITKAYPVLGSYYNDAAATVGIWNLIIVIGLNIPVAVFHIAISQLPTYQGDNTWVWSFTATLFNITYTAELTGVKLSDTTASWSMSITRSPLDVNGCCDNFVWYTGQTTSTTQGYWQFYDPTTPDQSNTTIKIDYNASSPTNKTLTFINNSSTPSTTAWGNGSYLEYILNGTDVTFTAKDSTKDHPSIITWDTDSTAGSIRYDNGSAMGCWNAAHNDATCP